MKPISRLNASKAIAQFDQQEAALVEQVKNWLKFEDSQQQWDELLFRCANDSEFRSKLFSERYPNSHDLIAVFAYHAMNQLLSKILAGWIAKFEEEGSSDE